jgi:MraZ protein
LWDEVGGSGTPGFSGVRPLGDELEHLFFGQYSHNIDSKGRLTVPVRFRDPLQDGAYVMQGFERNLIVYTTDDFKKLAQRASLLTTTNANARAVKRMIFGRATEVGLDSTGRILIPSFLREYAQLQDEVILVGAGEYFEVWDSKSWNQELVSVTDPDINAKRFTEFDLSTG